jgi:hypothetical protein
VLFMIHIHGSNVSTLLPADEVILGDTTSACLRGESAKCWMGGVGKQSKS